MKKLQLFNGRISLPNGNHNAHGYVAAYSKADAIRVLDEIVGGRPSHRGEIETYWSHGAWGDQMIGVTPERGLWVCDERVRFSEQQRPRRVFREDYEKRRWPERVHTGEAGVLIELRDGAIWFKHAQTGDVRIVATQVKPGTWSRLHDKLFDLVKDIKGDSE